MQYRLYSDFLLFCFHNVSQCLIITVTTIQFRNLPQILCSSNVFRSGIVGSVFTESQKPTNAKLTIVKG